MPPKKQQNNEPKKKKTVDDKVCTGRMLFSPMGWKANHNFDRPLA